MKKRVLSSLLVAMGLMLGGASAQAGDMISMSQMRLNDLGYFAGREDGIMGSQTRIALRDFQAYNGLPVTGNLDATSFNLLIAQDYSLYSGGLIKGRVAQQVNYVAPVNYGYMPLTNPEAQHVAYTYGYNGYPTQYVNAPAPMPVAYYDADGHMYTSTVWHY